MAVLLGLDPAIDVEKRSRADDFEERSPGYRFRSQRFFQLLTIHMGTAAAQRSACSKDGTTSETVHLAHLFSLVALAEDPSSNSASDDPGLRK